MRARGGALLSWWPLLLVAGTVFFNEYLIFTIQIGTSCDWPSTNTTIEDENFVNMFFIADTHLLGRHNGHWFDKLRREWQMWRSYRSALKFRPQAIVFLGDQMDEGQWANEELFSVYSDRFQSIFGVDNSDTDIYVVAGNHDVGFHYAINPHVLGWFETKFNRSLVDLINIKGNSFVLINSMALHGDGCRLCYEAEQQLQSWSTVLNCASNSSCEDATADSLRPYRRPIVLQHFPLFRLDEADCVRDADFDVEANGRTDEYRSGWDALSEEATRHILLKLNPRAVFNGHAHRDCKKKWSDPVDLWEYTVNSFSWRNGDRPTFLMARIGNSQVLVSKCFLPRESTVIRVYLATCIVLALWMLNAIYRFLRKRRQALELRERCFFGHKFIKIG